jgi:hypothetical protein
VEKNQPSINFILIKVLESVDIEDSMKARNRSKRNFAVCLIYVLRNKINNKVYIGQTWRSFKERFRYKKNQPHLYNAIKLYGKENFYYELLTVANTQEQADHWEGYFINKFEALDRTKGYNKRTYKLGRGIISEETKDKMRVKKLGIPLSETHKQHLSDTGSGEDNPAAKITNDVAREIYLTYLNDTEKQITIPQLAKKYKIEPQSINAILCRRTWSKATKDLPTIEKVNRNCGSYRKLSSLTDAIVFDIKTKYQNIKLPRKEVIEIIKNLTKLHSVSYATIEDILKNRTWKHIVVGRGSNV